MSVKFLFICWCVLVGQSLLRALAIEQTSTTSTVISTKKVWLHATLHDQDAAVYQDSIRISVDIPHVKVVQYTISQPSVMQYDFTFKKYCPMLTSSFDLEIDIQFPDGSDHATQVNLLEIATLSAACLVSHVDGSIKPIARTLPCTLSGLDHQLPTLPLVPSGLLPITDPPSHELLQPQALVAQSLAEEWRLIDVLLQTHQAIKQHRFLKTLWHIRWFLYCACFCLAVSIALIPGLLRYASMLHVLGFAGLFWSICSLHAIISMCVYRATVLYVHALLCIVIGMCMLWYAEKTAIWSEVYHTAGLAFLSFSVPLATWALVERFLM